MTLALLFVACQFATAQHDFRDGFYITLDNDSVPGKVAYRSSKKASEVCVFKSADGKRQRFNPSQIKGFGFVEGKRYTARTMQPEGPRFVEHIVSGRMHLLRHHRIYYLETDSLTLLQKEQIIERTYSDGRKFRGTINPYKNTLDKALAECKLSGNDVDYNEKELSRIVSAYNRCKGSPYVSYYSKKAGTKFTFQVFGGTDFSTLTIDGYPDAFKQSVSLAFGAGVDISFPRFSDRTFFSIEGVFTNKTYQGYLESYDAGSSTTTRADVVIKGSFAKIPVSVRYNFSHDSFTPYLKIGIVNYLDLTPTMRMTTETESGGSVVTTFGEGDVASQKQWGLWAGAGITKSLYKNLKGFAECRVEKSSGFLSEGLYNPNSKTAGFSVFVGLRF
jgi:hypothetical protein